ncbi:hypothetical protein MRX96_015020 [Rhipicephalus microplus]
MSNDGITISKQRRVQAAPDRNPEPGPRTKMHAAAKSAAGKGEQLAGRLSELGFASTPSLSMPTSLGLSGEFAHGAGRSWSPPLLPEGTFRSERRRAGKMTAKTSHAAPHI